MTSGDFLPFVYHSKIHSIGVLSHYVGEMGFDIPDIDRLVERGVWEAVIMHEMGQ